MSTDQLGEIAHTPEERVQGLMGDLFDLVEKAKATERAEHNVMAARRPAVVYRDQCRPDELCIACGREMGDDHDLLCSMFKKAFGAWTRGPR